MQWLNSLLFNEGIAHVILLYSLAISTGVLLGKVKFFGISLGPTFILFTGLLIGPLGVIPGIPMPVKLGLAGGPLIVSLIIGRFGYKFKLVTYTTQSANLMLREIGITLFLASVGISSGGQFAGSVFSIDGLIWVATGFLITTIPLIIMGFINRKFIRLNYFSLAGLLAGSTTDPPALSYAGSIANNDEPAVSYSTVYPLTMFLRVFIAQILILSFI